MSPILEWSGGIHNGYARVFLTIQFPHDEFVRHVYGELQFDDPRPPLMAQRAALCIAEFARWASGQAGP